MCDCACEHSNLKYNKCCNTVECVDCGEIWNKYSASLPVYPYTWTYSDDSGNPLSMDYTAPRM